MMIDAVFLIYSIFMIIVHVVIVCGIVRACAVSRRQEMAEPKEKFKISVIVPAKDEADNLPALFASLEKVMTPDVQVVLADDRSRDQRAVSAASRRLYSLSQARMSTRI